MLSKQTLCKTVHDLQLSNPTSNHEKDAFTDGKQVSTD